MEEREGERDGGERGRGKEEREGEREGGERGSELRHVHVLSTSSIFFDVIRSRTNSRVFFRTSRSAIDKTLSISITRS